MDLIQRRLTHCIKLEQCTLVQVDLKIKMLSDMRTTLEYCPVLYAEFISSTMISKAHRCYHNYCFCAH